LDRETSRPSFAELVRVFGKIGLVNFGGPAGQIALMHRLLVEERRWIDEDDYLRALNFCTLLPGPEAQQLATYVGWKLHGLRGGLAAGLLFILPGAAVVLGLSTLYAYAADLTLVAAALAGVKAAVLAIVVEALLRIARRALNTGFKRGLALASFLALAAFAAPFPAVLAVAAALGFVAAAAWPALLGVKQGPARAPQPPPPPPPPVRHARTFVTLGGWALIWAAPLAAAFLLLGPGHVLVEIGLFFSKLAMVTFGGAYAVLSYMAQEAVQQHGWLRPAEMVDGLGLAETTPGPLILVTEFVGFLAAFRDPAPFAPMVAGVLGALMTLWVTFSPCFLWIFAAAPYLERLQRARRLQGALAAITAAVVGVIGNLTLWFGLHVLFRAFRPAVVGPLRIELPDPVSLDWRAVLLAALAAIILFRLKLGVLGTIGLALCAGLTLHLLLPG
jgi:chromate transporter